MSDRLPQTRNDLHDWIRDELGLPVSIQQSLLTAIDAVFTRHEQLWAQSKSEAIEALSRTVAYQMARFDREQAAADQRANQISRYFEDLVAELTEQSRRDPKTNLRNFRHFVEHVGWYLSLEQRSRWCALGVADVADFKFYNDTFGHLVGDKILERVAAILREQVRVGDLLAHDRSRDAQEVHARFGGDEFCFFVNRLNAGDEATVVCERFRKEVAAFDWSIVHSDLRHRQVRVDVGTVGVLLGAVRERRGRGATLAQQLINRADQLMYHGKRQKADQCTVGFVRLKHGEIVDVGDAGMVKSSA